MYKVLIVDDESLSRYVVRDILKRNFPDYVSITEAGSGLKAVEHCLAESPDLVVMDIRMPTMDGLQASIEILKHRPRTIILILSAYDEFDFAKQAVDIGIKGYLLKPIREDEGIAVIRRMFTLIDQGKQNRHIGLSQELVNAKPYIRSALTDAIANGNCTECFESYKRLISDSIESGFFIVLQVTESRLLASPAQLEQTVQLIRNILVQQDATLPAYFVGSARYNQIPILFTQQDLTMEDTADEARYQLAEELLQRVCDKAEAALHVGVGQYIRDVALLHRSYHQAIIALQKLRYGKINLYRETYMESTPASAPYSETLEQALVSAMRCRSKAEIQTAIDDMHLYLQSSVFNLEIMKTYTYEILTVCIKTVRELAWVDTQQTGKYYQQIFQSTDNLPDLLQEMLVRITFPLLDKEVIPYDAFKTTMMQYIVQNLPIITLDSAADKAHLTPPYFSKVFKEEFRINFIDYLKDLRIAQVKTLLQDAALSMEEICNRVGYTNNAYFTRLFKKETGLTPIQYRQRMLGIERM